MRLTDYSSDVYSQFGEDGIIEHIFDRIDSPELDEDGHVIESTIRTPGQRTCIEFGASDDLACSNVANLWQNGNWKAILIEADPQRAAALRAKVNTRCEVQCRKVTSAGPNSIDQIFKRNNIDFMSIDVDGNDYHIWRKMETKPHVLCVEFNPTIPPHLSLHQEYDERMMGFGSSLKAFIDLGRQKDYTFIGATQINAFFVRSIYERRFLDHEADPLVLFPLTNYTFLITDFVGSAIGAGTKPPWGVHLPYVGPTIAGETFSITNNPRQTMEAYEERYGTIIKWTNENHPNIANPDFVGITPGGLVGTVSARNHLREYLDRGASPICIDISHIATEQADWVRDTAAQHGYHCRLGGGILAVIRSEP